jgi:uncharacterized GH25 family protein
MRGTVNGHVVRAGNEMPVAGATIDVVQAPHSGPLPEPVIVTDATGSFTLTELPQGEWVFSATSRIGRSQPARVHVFDNAASAVTIEVEETTTPRRRGGGGSTNRERKMTGSVRGRVVRAGSGEPVPDATIMVQGEGSAPDIAPLTNETGFFALDGLPPGEWLIRAVGPAGEAGEVSTMVSAGSVAEITIEVAG